MLFERLRATYEDDVPIYAEKVAKKFSLNIASVNQMLKRYCDQGKLERWGRGVYYFPKKSALFGKKKMDAEKVVQTKYIWDEDKPIGYYSDIALANIAGITTQMAATKTIVTNATSSRARRVTIGERQIVLKSPRIKVTVDNVNALKLMDLLTIADKYSEYDKPVTDKLIRDFALKNNIKSIQIQSVMGKYPKKAIAAVFSTEVYRVFT